MKEMYIDLYIQSSWKQAYIIDMKPNNKYDIVFLSPQEQIKRKNDIPFSSFSRKMVYSPKTTCHKKGVPHN